MFDSFFLGGFEGATGYNMHHEWIDQVAATSHDRFVDDDYRLLHQAGIRAARDAVRWPLVDVRGDYDFSTIDPVLHAGASNNIEIIYDLFHYGFPDDVDLFSSVFPERFAEYCYAVARYIAARTDGPLYFTPVNEPSYFAHVGGQVGWFAPYGIGRGFELKYALARAGIQAINAIWSACPGAQIVNVDPIVNVVPPPDRPDLIPYADTFNRTWVFESMDMLAGRIHPELGGSRKHLGIVGLNYYWTNQWQVMGEGTPLPADDPRTLPLSTLVQRAWERYGGDLLITETSHVGEMRPRWVRELTDEAEKMLEMGIGLSGICLYPILGMPEWHAQHEWTRMGLWDVHPERGRVRYDPMFEALQEAQSRLERLPDYHNRRGKKEQRARTGWALPARFSCK